MDASCTRRPCAPCSPGHIIDSSNASSTRPLGQAVVARWWSWARSTPPRPARAVDTHLHATLGGAKVFRCPRCALVIDRDHNGARNVLLKNASLFAFEVTTSTGGGDGNA